MIRRQHAHPFRAWLLLLSIAGVVLAGCGGSDSGEEAEGVAGSEGQGAGETADDEESARFPSTPEKTSIKLGLGVVTSAYTPFHIASEEGLWEEEGLDVELVTFQGGSETLGATLGGSIDLAVIGLPEIATAREADQPVRAIFAGWNHPTFEFWSVPEIESMDDVGGTAWGVTRIGSQTDFVTRYFLEENGYDPDTDVTIVQAGRSAERLAAMREGVLQVNGISSPSTFEAEELGFKKLGAMSDVVPDFPYATTMATEQFIEQNPGTITAFLRGLSKAIEMTKDDPELFIEVGARASDVDPKWGKRVWEETVKDLHADGRLPSDEGMEAFWQMAVDNGTVEEKLPNEELFDFTWIDNYDEWKP